MTFCQREKQAFISGPFLGLSHFCSVCYECWHELMQMSGINKLRPSEASLSCWKQRSISVAKSAVCQRASTHPPHGLLADRNQDTSVKRVCFLRDSTRRRVSRDSTFTDWNAPTSHSLVLRCWWGDAWITPQDYTYWLSGDGLWPALTPPPLAQLSKYRQLSTLKAFLSCWVSLFFRCSTWFLRPCRLQEGKRKEF